MCYHYRQHCRVFGVDLGSMATTDRMLCRGAEHFYISYIAMEEIVLWLSVIKNSGNHTKMGRNGHVTTEILLKICTALDCKIEDIMKIVEDK